MVGIAGLVLGVGLTWTTLKLRQKRQQNSVAEIIHRKEQTIRTLLTAAVDGIVIIDTKGIILSVNPALERMFGHEAAALIGQNVKLLMPSPYREEHDSYIRNYLNSGVSKIIGIGRELTAQRKDGTIFPIDLSIGEIIDGQRFFLGIIRDITRRKSAENTLLQEQAFIEAIIETAAVIIVVLDVDGKIVRFNSTGEKLSGYDRQEVIGRKPTDFLISNEDVPAFKDVMKSLSIGKKPFIWEGACQAKDNRRLEISWSVTFLGAPEEKPPHFIAIGLDLTENRFLERQVSHMQHMEALGLLAGGIAHDFNNLLTVMQGSIELLEARLPESRLVHEAIDDAKEAADLGSHLTHRLLAFARRQPLEAESVDLSELVLSMSALLRRTLRKGIVVEVDIPGGLWPVLSDRSQIETALLNLAVNARDAMERGGTLRIKLSNAILDDSYVKKHPEATPGEYVSIRVSDTGSGMPPEILERIFEPFFTTKMKTHGTGLGLSMVHGFAKQSGGHIEVESALGQGTTFSLFLPKLCDDRKNETVTEM